MKTTEVLQAWGRILTGRAPSLSIEITRECPLACPGCYAYNDDHLNNGVPLRELPDLRGAALVDGVIALAKERRPLHISIVGGDPMVRLFELEELLPTLTGMGIHCQIVTSAFRKIPAHWKSMPRVGVVVSIDGQQPEHDKRRRPATYDRILKNVADARITVHCTVTRQMTVRPGYLSEFVAFWEERPEVEKIWISLYTPQKGEISSERLTADDRRRVVAELLEMRSRSPKLDLAEGLIEAYLAPPSSPKLCTFARTTETISADLVTRITPCQFGGDPDCSQCGCIASAGLHAVANHRLFGIVRTGSIYDVSEAIGRRIRRSRRLVEEPAR